MVRIARSAPPSSARRALAALGLGALGCAEVLLVYGWLGPNLPANIPSHYAWNGAVDGTAAPWTFVLSSLSGIVFVTGLLAGLLYFAGRSAPLQDQFGSSLPGVLLTLEVLVAVVALPAVTILQLANAAGALPNGVPVAALAGLIGGVLPVGYAVFLAIRLRHSLAGRPDPSRNALGRAATGGGLLSGQRVLELRCSSCGQSFRLTNISIFTPHLATGTQGSLYVRCTACGERGWDAVLRRTFLP